MKRGILYGVGVGPGDPELITRKAQRIIAQAAVLAVLAVLVIALVIYLK